MPRNNSHNATMKEDRSGWVAVPPDASSSTTTTGRPVVKRATTAYQFFQRDVAAKLKKEQQEGIHHHTMEIGEFGRYVRDQWALLTEEERDPYIQLQRQDQSRFAQESHEADLLALQRKQRLQQEREQLILDESLLDDDHDYDEHDDNRDEDADDDENYNGQVARRRTTRGILKKKLKKVSKLDRRKQRQEKKRQRRQKRDDDEPEANHDDESDSEGSWDSDELQDDDEDDNEDDEDGVEKKKKLKKNNKASKKPIALTEKQLQYRSKQQEVKREKQQYVAERQEDLKKEKMEQAKRRLEFLLKQSNIFSHFGRVREDTARFGIASAAPTATTSGPKGGKGNSSDRQQQERGGARRTALLDHDQNDDDEGTSALEEADEHDATFLTTQPSTLGFGQMRDYQLEGLNWMIRLQENGVNGILADEMGLGKTLQAVSILVYMMEYRSINGPHLIVVPKSTLSNWMNELSRWAPTINAVKFHGDKATREDIVNTILLPGQRDEDRDWHVCVTTYEVCNIEKSALNKFAWCYLIIDEAHRLKNEASKFSVTVRTFETRYRILLTGTPLQNSLHELWSLLNFLVPDVFESAEQFDDWFNLDIEDNDEKNKLISQLHKILRPFMLRRLKVDVEKSLPPKHETILFTGMSSMQKKLYRDILVRDIEAIQGTSGSRASILNIVMELRKAAGHPYLFPGVEDRSLPLLGEHLVENCGKMVVLDKLLRRLRERGHRVLLFTQMTRILDIMEDYLVMRRFLYCRIDGNTTYEDREAFIDAFNAPDSEKFIFLLSTRAGGLGINLQTADVVILYDSDWNPQADLQAQDRAHRIGQKKPVQIFRLVTEHTIEEKIVERAQQKLKLDAMVVQSGRLKEKDKLSRDELLAAVRFGADKIFKSKDSSITDDDIDYILDVGKRKTQELNEKLKTAEKGDLLDFKLDGGSSLQTFEGVDYSSSALAQARAEADLLGIFDIGKRERKGATYNERDLFQQQIAAMQGGVSKKAKKKKDVRLPKHLRLPRMEDWQLFDRAALLAIQEEEEAVFKELPEDVQRKAALAKDEDGQVHVEGGEHADREEEPFVLPPLLSKERQTEKESLLSEGFSEWNRYHYQAFVKACGKYGRHAIEKIAVDVGKPDKDVRDYVEAFWGQRGKDRIPEQEYDRVVKLIEKGEKKIDEIKGLERGTRILIAHFNNPWEELEFTHVNCKDKMFTAEEDRHLLCWTRKYGYGQWHAVALAIRRNPHFRFDYFLRSLPVEQIGRRCEQLMKAAEKEVEHLEQQFRQENGLPTEPENGEDTLPPVQLPKFHVLQKKRREVIKSQSGRQRRELEEKLSEIQSDIKKIQRRLKALSEESSGVAVSSFEHEEMVSKTKKESLNRADRPAAVVEENSKIDPVSEDNNGDGAVGPDGKFVAFPVYDGSEHPEEWKKPFTLFCNGTRKQVKASLDPEDRKDKKKVNLILKERWFKLPDDKKSVWRQWTDWDKKRHDRDLAIFESRRAGGDEAQANEDDNMEGLHVPKKRKDSISEAPSIPKKKVKR